PRCRRAQSRDPRRHLHNRWFRINRGGRCASCRRRSSGGGRHCGSRHRSGRTCSRNRRCAIPIRIFEKRPGPALRLNQRKDLQMSKVQPTAGLVTAGMIGGYVAARVTKIRPLGGILLGACGIASSRRWYDAFVPVATAISSPSYLAVFGASHPLAKKIGSWTSVLVSTAAAAGAERVLNDKQCPQHSTKPVGKTVK